ncbi:hypothetical protein [Alteromonas lipolytica]|uniref:Uncharacterized protein n=1 Tax=Alteromonas lipolytica TaxID=1856405 RepID=A0A1E8FCZ2_9ALTE|nr:hypothetical protein [Alteromonas lipolytica]OFI33807.1 hypothetical protein BFC17_19755 [Alteromonas lipolytica]GGF68188.1 hypothetical protein GCM10011338_20520 [Alteromonas lipolytica]
MEDIISKVDSSPTLKYGSYTIHLSGSLLLLFFRGTWSEKCATDYARDVSRFRNEHGLEKFASIAVISDWQLGTPGAIETVSEVIRRGGETGMVAQFLLADGSNNLSLHIARQNVEKAFPGTITGQHLAEFIPELTKHNIEFNEQRVLAILQSNGYCG